MKFLEWLANFVRLEGVSRRVSRGQSCELLHVNSDEWCLGGGHQVHIPSPQRLFCARSQPVWLKFVWLVQVLSYDNLTKWTTFPNSKISPSATTSSKCQARRILLKLSTPSFMEVRWQHECVDTAAAQLEWCSCPATHLPLSAADLLS